MAKAAQAQETNNNGNGRDFYVNVVEASRDLTAKERVMMKDTAGCISLNAEVEGGRAIEIDVDAWVHLAVHNENAKGDKDYDNYIIIDKEGKKYSTGSPSFWTSFRDIMAEMEGIDEAWKLKVGSYPSATRPGKEFLKCSVI